MRSAKEYLIEAGRYNSQNNFQVYAGTTIVIRRIDDGNHPTFIPISNWDKSIIYLLYIQCGAKMYFKADYVSQIIPYLRIFYRI